MNQTTRWALSWNLVIVFYNIFRMSMKSKSQIGSLANAVALEADIFSLRSDKEKLE